MSSSFSLDQPIVSGSGRVGFVRWACFHLENNVARASLQSSASATLYTLQMYFSADVIVKSFRSPFLRAWLHGEFQPVFCNKSFENQTVDYMEKDSARGAIQPGLKILARYSQGLITWWISARAEIHHVIRPLGFSAASAVLWTSSTMFSCYGQQSRRRYRTLGPRRRRKRFTNWNSWMN